jgi:uncharacterized protein (TIGR00369 family)
MTTSNFNALLQQKFVEFTTHAGECGMEITHLDASGAEVLLPFREDWLGDVQRQVIHTGIVTTLVDSACGAAVLAHIGSFEPIATIDLRMDYLRPSLRDLPLYCFAECCRLTSHIAFARASVWQKHRDEPVAIAQGAFMRSGRRAAAAHKRTGDAS